MNGHVAHESNTVNRPHFFRGRSWISLRKRKLRTDIYPTNINDDSHVFPISPSSSTSSPSSSTSSSSCFSVSFGSRLISVHHTFCLRHATRYRTGAHSLSHSLSHFSAISTKRQNIRSVSSLSPIYSTLLPD